MRSCLSLALGTLTALRHLAETAESAKSALRHLTRLALRHLARLALRTLTLLALRTLTLLTLGTLALLSLLALGTLAALRHLTETAESAKSAAESAATLLLYPDGIAVLVTFNHLVAVLVILVEHPCSELAVPYQAVTAHLDTVLTAEICNGIGLFQTPYARLRMNLTRLHAVLSSDAVELLENN